MDRPSLRQCLDLGRESSTMLAGRLESLLDQLRGPVPEGVAGQNVANFGGIYVPLEQIASAHCRIDRSIGELESILIGMPSGRDMGMMKQAEEKAAYISRTQGSAPVGIGRGY